MSDILSILYKCAMDNKEQSCLMQDELRDYQSALKSEEKVEEKLGQLLEDETLRLFNLYVENRNDEQYFADVSAFRKGLSIGLKLGAYCLTEH